MQEMLQKQGKCQTRFKVVEPAEGFEPSASSLQDWHSSQLSYAGLIFKATSLSSGLILRNRAFILQASRRYKELMLKLVTPDRPTGDGDGVSGLL
jgi:hypothetical protein